MSAFAMGRAFLALRRGGLFLARVPFVGGFLTACFAELPPVGIRPDVLVDPLVTVLTVGSDFRASGFLAFSILAC